MLPTLLHPIRCLTWAWFSSVAKLMENLFLIKSGERVLLFNNIIHLHELYSHWTESVIPLNVQGESEFQKSSLILIITFYILILQFSILNNKYEPHMITCSALCALYITDNLSFETFFQEMNASLKVIDCTFVVFKLFVTVS